MNPALAVAIIQALIELLPFIREEVALFLAKGNPTAADWEALRAHLTLTYEDYIDNAGGRPQGPTPP